MRSRLRFSFYSSTLDWKEVSSAPDDPKPSWKPEKNVIAVVANAAAFDLCGSSQNVGTEVKSS